VYFYYCYIGARQRGNLKNLFLMPLGVSRSVGEGRVNPESEQGYHAFCELAFGSARHNLLSMTDGAMCYRCRCERCCLWFEEHHYVNHSRKPMAEFSRPIEAVVADVATGETRPAMAGTMTLDSEWGLLKNPLPKLEAASEAAMERCDLLLRAQQFRRMLSTQDRWPAFVAGARRWMAMTEKERGSDAAKASEFAKKHAAELALARESTTGEGQECETSLGVRDAREQEALQTGVADVVPESQADAAGADSAVQEEPPLEVIIDELTAAELDRLEVALQEARARKEEPQQRDAGLRVKLRRYGEGGISSRSRVRRAGGTPSTMYVEGPSLMTTLCVLPVTRCFPSWGQTLLETTASEMGGTRIPCWHVLLTSRPRLSGGLCWVLAMQAPGRH
jgi:hypothetical protein